MLSRNEVKYIQSLCHKKTREEEKQFIVEGPKLAEEILNSDWTILKLYALKSWIEKQSATVQKNSIEISEKELAQISDLQTPNQVVIVAEQKEMQLNEQESGWTLVLDGIQDPGNLGTIIRIADWFAVKQIVCSEDTAELYNPKVIQSTMGSFLRTNLVYWDIENFLKKTKLPVYGAMLNGENLFELKNPQKGLIIIGNESKGIRTNIQPYIKQNISIPKLGGAESLNAGVATGIIVAQLTK